MMFTDDRDLFLAIDRDIIIRDAATGHLREILRINRYIASADIHPNTRSLVTLTYDGEVWVQDLWDDSNPGRQAHGLSKRVQGGVSPHFFGSSVSYSADGSRIVCYSDKNNEMVVWSTDNISEPLCKIRFPKVGYLKTLSVDRDREHLAAVLKDEHTFVQYWNLSTGEELKSLQLTTDEVRSAAFAKGKLVTKHDEKICVLSLDGDCATLSTTILTRGSDPVDITCSGNVIATAHHDYSIRLWDAHTGA
jgi:WD40 repeat protein